MKHPFSVSHVSMFGLVGLALFGAGCNPFANLQERIAGKVVENVVENQIKKETGKDVNVDLSGQTVTVTGPEGAGTFTAGEDVKLPADFPKSIPIYPGSKVKSAITIAGEDGASLVLETSDTPTKARDWYKTEAAATGWKQEAALDLEGDSHMLAFNREDGGATWRITVSTSPSGDGKTGIVVGYGKK